MDLVFQIFFTGMGAFLSVVLTKSLIQNRKAFAELWQRMDQRTAKIAEMVESMTERRAKMAGN